MAKTAADLLIERLLDWGVDTIFGLPGDGINGVFDALRTHQDKLRFIQVRHEEAAAFMACGYAKFTGRLGVCMATSGPGGIHLANGLYDATMDGQPVLAITGHTFHDLIGTRQQQDVALDKLYQDACIFSERIAGPHHVTNAIDEAIRLALTHRRAAHVTIPKDIQTWSADTGKESMRNVAGHSDTLKNLHYPLPAEQDLQHAATVLNAGHKLAILAGQGALGAGTELEQVAELMGGVIIKPLLGKGVVPDESPYTTGGIGLLGTAPSQEAIESCDTLLMVGTSFPYESFYPKPGQARCVQIDINAGRIGLRYPVEVSLVGDAGALLRSLIPFLRRNGDRSFLEAAQSGMREWWDLMRERAARMDAPMKPQVVAAELDRLLADDAIVTTDSGTITTWIARHLRLRGRQQFSVSGNLATMACAFPYAIGAQVAYPNRQVIAYAGDGGFTMLMGELATCVKYNLPVKVIITKNNVLGQIKWEQMILEGFPEFGVELQPIDFATVAEGFGVRAFTLEDPREASRTLREALDHPGPALVQAVVDANEPPMPPMVKRDQAVHFAEALLKGQPERVDIGLKSIRDYARQIV
jgi:thiamine pyrophosphate-dependent acetolactate synthase large subunit-like protein